MRALPKPVLLAAAILIGVSPGPGHAAGPPFAISGEGSLPAIAKSPDGRFCVAWVSSALNAIFARRYGGDDQPLGRAVVVGAYNYYSATTSVAPVGDDRYWVAWDSYGHYFGSSAQARLVGADGPDFKRTVALGLGPSLTPIGRGGIWAAASATRAGVSVQIRGPGGSRIAATSFRAPGGGFAAPGMDDTLWVVYSNRGRILLRQISRGGATLQTLTVARSTAPPSTLAGNGKGDLVVVWSADGALWARWLRPQGGLGEGQRIADFTSAAGHAVSAAIDAEGKTLVVWQPCCFTPGILARRFERGGIASGPPTVLGSDLPSFQPAAAAGAANEFTLVWVDALGVRGQSVGWARPGDELCLFEAGLLRCDTAHDGGRAELEAHFGGLGNTIPLLGDLDGDGRDDLCLRRAGSLRCDSNHDGGAADAVQPLLYGDFQTFLLGDVDGDGRDDLCGWRLGRLECDSAHNGGTAEVVVVSAADGAPLLGDVDGDGDDELCLALAGELLCDPDHDGEPEIQLRLPAARPDDQPLLGDVDGDGIDDPCVYDGERLRCDVRRDGSASFELAFPGASGFALLGNPDGI